MSAEAVPLIFEIINELVFNTFPEDELFVSMAVAVVVTAKPVVFPYPEAVLAMFGAVIILSFYEKIVRIPKTCCFVIIVPVTSGRVIVLLAVNVPEISVVLKLDVPPARPAIMTASFVVAGRAVIDP